MTSQLLHTLRRHLRTCLGSAAFIALAATASAGVFEWQDNSVGYRFSDRYREPTVANHITKHIVQLQHSDAWKYGSNFANLDILRSKNNDGDVKAGSTTGATEFYFVYRGTLSVPKIFGTPVKSGFIRDYGLTIGTDLSNKNDAFHAKVRELYVGPSVSFNVPGYLTVSLLLDKENNYNGIVGAYDYFKPTWCVAVAWGMPVGKTPFFFKGFANVMGPKGKDGFGADTTTEFLLEAALMFDPFYSNAARKGKFGVGVGYQYWYNKFGNDHKDMPGAIASVPQLLLEYHF